MEITQGEYLSMFPRNNYVLLKPVHDMGKTVLKSGVELFVDNLWKPENHANVICEVCVRPIEVFFNRKRMKYSMDWLTDLDLLVGEKVWISYLAALQAEKKFHIIIDGEKYYFIRYEDIYLTIRDNDIRMLNGYILIEPIKEKQESNFIITVDNATNAILTDGDGTQVRKSVDDKLGIVKHIGRPNREYINKKQWDDDYISIGDKVLMKYKNNVRLEADSHMVLFDHKMIVTQRRHISMIMR